MKKEPSTTDWLPFFPADMYEEKERQVDLFTGECEIEDKLIKKKNILIS